MRRFSPRLAAAILLSTSPAFAGDATISAALGFESRYVFRGVQFAETSIQPSVTIAKDGFHLGAWFNLPIGDDDGVNSVFGEELDLVVGYSRPVASFLTIDAGLTFYVFPEADSGFFDFYEEDGDGLGSNTLEPYVSFAFTAPLSPVVTLYRDFMYDTFTVQATGGHKFPITGTTTFDVGGLVGYVIDDDMGTDYLYGVANAGFSYQVSEKSAISAGVRYGGSDLAGGSLIDDSIAATTKSSGFWWGIGFTTSL